MSVPLSQVDPELVELVERASDEACRNAAIAAAEFAIQRAGLRDHRIDDVMQKMREGVFGATLERSAVEALVAALDERSWDVRDAIHLGEATQDEYTAAFSSARAATCVFDAADEDPRRAALGAFYEASYTVDDPLELRPIVVPILTG